ncbi:juvenile hormone esterase-like [Haematobia irritans]|uniref:juvenile hormone esterase-like n=1 Tax=Haematobia irritans TaxID=7368 RepID=UPI003F502F76
MIKYWLIFNAIFLTKCSATPTVRMDNNDFNGPIEGVEKLNIFNESFVAFMGLPYAKPPVGDLRFRDPQKLEKIEGSYNAKYQGYECHSITATNASEDCLYLNVYTKEITPSQSLPVVVMIHPGGLYLGSSNWMEPSLWMSKEIVLVTFNYRLGSLGFLNLGTKSIPGNAGFKDQVYALRWIQRNIERFGGNPHDITLMGYSAGALSVSLHLVSPMSKGLFHKAIIMSGSMPPQIKMTPQGNQKYLAVRQAKKLKCENFNDMEDIQWDVEGHTNLEYENLEESDILSCMSKFSGLEIAKTLRSMFDFGKDNPIYLWLPVVEEDYGQERFLLEDFYTLLNKTNKIDVPLLVGYTNGEFCTSASDILKNMSLKESLENNFLSLAPRVFGYESWKNKKTIGEELLHYYFEGRTKFTLDDYDAMCNLFSDSLIRFGAHQTAEMVSQKGTPVYFYEFQYQKPSNQMDAMFTKKQDRVEHMDDLQYLFNWSNKKDFSQDDLDMVKMYTSFIFDFIKNGKLSDSEAKLYPLAYASLQNQIKYKEGKNFQNLEFFKNLFKNEN